MTEQEVHLIWYRNKYRYRKIPPPHLLNQQVEKLYKKLCNLKRSNLGRLIKFLFLTENFIPCSNKEKFQKPFYEIRP